MLSYEDSHNPDKPYAYVMEFDKSALEKSALKLEEGRMPENSNEILIPRHLLENGRINIKVGDTITLDIGTRQLTDGSKLTQSNSYLTEDTLAGETAIEDIPTEEIVDTKAKTYTVVGIIKRASYNLEDYSAPGYTLISYMDNTDNIKNVYSKIDELMNGRTQTYTMPDFSSYYAELSRALSRTS